MALESKFQMICCRRVESPRTLSDSKANFVFKFIALAAAVGAVTQRLFQ
jgi:hypothetical protein